MASAPIAKEVADTILTQSIAQLQMSRTNKRARMAQIKESDDLYLGIAEKAIRNPFNECFPFMAGFVDHMRSKIDDDSNLLFVHQAEADLEKTQKINAFYEMVSKSPAPNDSWEIKHRYAKYNAISSGVAIYKYFAEKNPEYKSHLEVVSHYDFHNEPRGGGQIENHLFCGQDNIFKNEEDLKEDHYDKENVERLVKAYEDNGWKEPTTNDTNRDSRAQALQQNPQTNNYVGQGVIKLVEWYTTYKGKRYYILFSEAAQVRVRCVLLTELFPDNLWPTFAGTPMRTPTSFGLSTVR